MSEEKYIRKIFTPADLARLIKPSQPKFSLSQNQSVVLSVLMNTVILHFITEVTNQPFKYGLSKVLDLVPQYKHTRRGILQTDQANSDIVYFMNYQDLLYGLNTETTQKSFFIVVEFGLSGEAQAVNKFFKYLRSYVKQRNFTRWYKKATSWLTSQPNYQLLSADVKNFFHWNSLKMGVKA